MARLNQRGVRRTTRPSGHNLKPSFGKVDSFTFWVTGEDNHEYRVHQYTEFLETEIRGKVYRESGKLYYLTDGGDAVSHVGGDDFYIPKLNVMAKWLKEGRKVELRVPGLFMGFKDV